MMLFRDALTRVKGWRFLAEQIPLRSSAGRRLLYDIPFMTDREQLEEVYRKTGELIRTLWNTDEKNGRGIPDFGLGQLKDIRGTLQSLERKAVPGDIELFEIKELALLASRVREQLQHIGLSVVDIPDVTEVIALLDPEGTRISQFYVYDAYDARLAEIRKKTREEKEEAVRSDWRIKEIELEDEIREKISKKLIPHAELLMKTHHSLAELDVLLGKAEFAVRFRLVEPELVKDRTVYMGLLHLAVKHELEQKSLCYQPVDISVEPLATVITGANMAGKSVLLKALMLAQYMAQFGLYVPARKAQIALVDEIWVTMGDEQDEQKGLSSFAAEMLSINEMIHAVRAKKRILALIDEPARTTNPEEGKAIVSALVGFLNRHQVLSVVTTHYGGLSVTSKRLRVKGFMADQASAGLSLRNINSFIDYTLIEDKEENVPHEALRIAEILGIDKELTDQAKLFLNTNDAKE